MSDCAIIYGSELDYISRWILDYPHIETGGQLFGYWTDDGTPVVLYAIGPGPQANHQIAFFNQDIAYLETVGNQLTRTYGLQHIGEWHSHHGLGLSRPSGHDAKSMADGIMDSGRNRFLLCIGTCVDGVSRLLPYNFEAGRWTDYVSAKWIIKPMDSPFRKWIDAELAEELCMPLTEKANDAILNRVRELSSY